MKSIIAFCFVLVIMTVPTQGGEVNMKDDKLITLPSPRRKSSFSIEEALEKRRSVRNYKSGVPVSLEQLSQILWAAQGLSGSDKTKRTAPSAGATYPLEVYVVVGNVTGLESGIYKYVVKTHQLEKLKTGDFRRELALAALGQNSIANAPLTLVIAAEYERTALRYGARAERYVHIEVGHVGQNVYLQCESLGLGTVAVGAFDDQNVKKLLPIPQEPLYLMPVGKK